MSFFKNILRTLRSVKRSDSTFGEMTWFAGRPPRPGYWEGKASLQAEGIEWPVEVFLHGDETGPNERQRTFFKEISGQLHALRQSVGELAPTRPDMGPLEAERLQVRWAALPPNPQNEAWELGFDIQGAPKFHLIAHAVGWGVKDLSIED